MRKLSCMVGVFLTVLWAAPIEAQGPGGTVRGRVVDEATQLPLAGVIVTVGGRNALTRSDGLFVITAVPAGTQTLQARSLGYAPSEQSITVTAGEEVVVSIAMTAQAIGLSAVVVTGYGEQRTADITGAVSQVSSDEFNGGRIVTPAQLIAAKVPGVQVVDNNEPGGGIAIRVRGPTSVNASSEPLYVIDGLPVGTGAGGGISAGRDALNFLNPNDIESITVLRDASAAAIYGANAANGVVIITTKSGTAGGQARGQQVEYTSSFSTSTVTRTPDMLNAAEFRIAVDSFAPQSSGQLLNESTDWFGQVTRSAFGQEHNLSLTSFGDNTNWRLSLGYLNQDGIILGTTAERLSLGLNYKQLLFDDRLDVRLNLKGSRTADEFTPGGVLSNAAQMGPTQPILDPTSLTGFYEWPNNALTSADNPVAILALATDRGTTYRGLGNVQVDYRTPMVPGLRGNVSLGFDVTRAQRQSFTPGVLHSETKTGRGGADSRSTPSQGNVVGETYLNYAAPVEALRGNIDVTAGYSYSQSHAEFPSYFATGLATDVLGGNGVTPATTVQNFQDIQESKLISFFGRFNYNYRDRYLLAASIRRDGSSRFGPGNEWGTFPSFSLGWRLSQESFLQNWGALSDLKLRVSWAKTGNQAFGNYLQYSTYLTGDNQTTVQFGNEFVPTIRPNAVDPNIKWEETTALNFGLDFGFLSQRITGSIDVYSKKTEDLIFFVPVAAGTNLSNFLTTNIGSMKNTGVELGLSAEVLRPTGRGLGWVADLTLFTNTNELTSINPRAGSAQILVGGIAGGVGTTIQVLQAGLPVNSFFVLEHRRDANGRPIFATGAGADTAMYVDQNGDGIITVDDRRAFNDPTPDWIIGHSSYLTYGNFDLNMTFRAYLGNYVYNNVASNLGTYAEVTRASPYNLHRSVLETGFETPQYLSDYYVEDASFLRLDNITLAYTFNYRGQPWRVFGAVQNAFTITGYTGVDPTAGLNGIDNNIYPRSRTFLGGLSVRF